MVKQKHPLRKLQNFDRTTILPSIGQIYTTVIWLVDAMEDTRTTYYFHQSFVDHHRSAAKGNHPSHYFIKSRKVETHCSWTDRETWNEMWRNNFSFRPQQEISRRKGVSAQKSCPDDSGRNPWLCYSGSHSTLFYSACSDNSMFMAHQFGHGTQDTIPRLEERNGLVHSDLCRVTRNAH